MSCADLNCADMVVGNKYTFFFRFGGYLQSKLDSNAVAAVVSKDSNFQNPSAYEAHCGILDSRASVMAVSFTYNGQGSTVGQAGNEMQQILNNFWLMGFGTSLIFDHAAEGVVPPCCDCVNVPGGNYLLWLAIGAVALVVIVANGWHEQAIEVIRG